MFLPSLRDINEVLKGIKKVLILHEPFGKFKKIENL